MVPSGRPGQPSITGRILPDCMVAVEEEEMARWIFQTHGGTGGDGNQGNKSNYSGAGEGAGIPWNPGRQHWKWKRWRRIIILVVVTAAMVAMAVKEDLVLLFSEDQNEVRSRE